MADMRSGVVTGDCGPEAVSLLGLDSAVRRRYLSSQVISSEGTKDSKEE